MEEKRSLSTLPPDRSLWWDVNASPPPPFRITNLDFPALATFKSGGMSEIRRPVLIQAPEDAYIVRNRPAKLTCRAIYADRINFKCDGEWVRQEEHEFKQGVEAVSELPYLEASVNVHRPNVGSHGIGCECYAYTTNGATAGAGATSSSGAGGNFGVKSDRATVKIAALSKHFLQEPASERQPVSSMVQLRCTAPDGEPKPEIYWLKDGREIEARADPNVIIAHDGSLIIAAARVSDSGLYTCGARNVANHRLSQAANVTIYVNGQWSEWSSWNGECPEDCEEQSRLLQPYPKLRRYRKCNQPIPANGGQPCDGLPEQDMDCELPCPMNGAWSAWSEWTKCRPTSSSSSVEDEDYDRAVGQQRSKMIESAPAGSCRKRRTRMCDNPAPRNRGLSCVGPAAEHRNCTIGEICQGNRLESSHQNGVISNGSGSSSTPTDINLAMYSGLGAAAVVFVLVFFLLFALLMRRRASCHRCGVNSHYKEYETVSVMENGRRYSGSGRPQPVILQNGGSSGKFVMALSNGRSIPRSGSGCGLPSDLMKHGPVIYDSAHPPSSLKSDQSRMGLLASRGWSAHQSDSSGDRSHCTSDDNYATVDDPFVVEPSFGPPNYQKSSVLSTLIPPNVPATWGHFGPEGGCLQLPEYGVSLLVPPGAVTHDRAAEIFLAVLPDVLPRLTSATAREQSQHKAMLSPVVWCGPVELALRKPVVLTFDHCAHLLPSTSTNGGWRVAVYECDQKVDEQARDNREMTPMQFSLSSASDVWQPAAVMGRETLNTTVYCQLDPDCVHLLTDTLNRFVLVGEYDAPTSGSTQSQPPQHASNVSKRCRLLAFVSPLDCSVRIYCVDDTKTAVRRALNAERESGAAGRLACEPQLFQLQPGAELCLCMEEVTPTWRRRNGANYQEIPAAHLWPSLCTGAASSTLAPLHCSFALETSSPHSTNERVNQKWSTNPADAADYGQQQVLIQARVIVYQKGDTSGSRCVLGIDTTVDWPIYVYGLERRTLTLKLSSDLRLQISQLLDQPNERENDWRMLARQLAVDHYLPYFAARPSPTELILLLWETRERGPRAAVQLMQLFYAMQRPDVAELVALYLEEI